MRYGPRPAPQGRAEPATCKDETRFQGIATIGFTSRPTSASPPPCRDETRFQGIATRCYKHPGWRRKRCRLAGTRPVFRGLRRYKRCDKQARPDRHLVGTRPVFRGLRRGPGARGGPRWPSCRLAGTRPVFRGLQPRSQAGVERCNLAAPCKDKTRFQGIATRASRIRRASESTSEGLQGRGPFSGDCNVGATRRVAPAF